MLVLLFRLRKVHLRTSKKNAMDERDPEKKDSNALFTELAQGGEAAFASLFSKYRRDLLRMVELRIDRRVAARVDSSDVLQETYLEASRQLSGYLNTRHAPPKLWLRLVARQQLMAIHRRHLGAQMRDANREISLNAPVKSPVSTESLSIFLADNLATPSELAEQAELQTRLLETLEKMESIDREILVMRHFDELTNSEIAVELNISQAAASNRYFRALERLKRALASL